MKTYIKYFELLAAIIVGIPVFFNIMPFPIIIVNIVVACCAVYYYLMSCIKYEYSDIRFSLKKLSFISICIVSVGTLFRLNHYPDGSFMVMIGTIVSFPMLIYYFTQFTKKDVAGNNELPEIESKHKTILFILKMLSYLSIGIVCLTVYIEINDGFGSPFMHCVFMLALGAIVAIPAIINRSTKAHKTDRNEALADNESKPNQIAYITDNENNKFTSLGMLIRLCVTFAFCLKLFLWAWIIHFFNWMIH